MALARILRPRGNKGEVAAQVLTDFPERIAKIREVYLGDSARKNEPRRAVLARSWLSQNHPGQIVLHFENYSSINEAEKLRGLDVLIPFEQRVILPSGQHFVSDLVGCSVFEIAAEPSAMSSSPCSLAEAPALLGVVRDVEIPGEGMAGTPLLEVETRNGDVLIPLAVDICTRIDTAARRIEVRLPEGLRDLNAGE